MPLTDEEIANFKTRLLEMKAKLSHTLEGNAQEVKKPNEATGYSQHQADQAQIRLIELSAWKLLLKSINFLDKLIVL